MGILDFLKSTQESINAFQQKVITTPPETLIKQVNGGEKQRTGKVENERKPNRVAKQIINQFYIDYPEIPYISNNRKKDWIEQAVMFPTQNIIPKSIMTRYADGLLPGHVYMLFWLKKYTNKDIPAYFEYKYGLDFEKEKEFLLTKGFLNNLGKPTEKGEKAISDHKDVIENHAPKKPDRTIEGISKQILKQKANFIKNGVEKYTFVANHDCCEKCAALNEKHFLVSEMKIGINAPPMHEGCKCAVAPWVDREELDALLDFISKGGTTNEWEAMKKRKKN